ncbi:hypothetical protein SAMN05428971_1399 [Candidatus Pantoea varia]|uniref:Uncharacterized protein n=1 Tax=Candidatus Pantoea varia TaxID=1881036 RepID=A0A1I4YY92_9GAMM|nr:hypothetical protein [Pantoea varia]SFN42743.1 hypothetical protein SAMN05428971_1399 [Pantoea varia]
MDGIRGHGRTPTPGHEDIALRSRPTASTSAAEGVNPADAARIEEIARIQSTLEKESTGGAEVREHMHEVAVTLHDEMGQSADDVRSVIKSARQSDKGTSALAEAAIGMAYGLSGLPGDLAGKALARQLNLEPGTQAHDFVTGLTGGLTAVAFKAVVSKLVDNSLRDGKWMQADKDALKPFMQEVMKRHYSLGHKVQQAGLGGAGYNLRNPVTAAISAGTQKFAENAPRAQPMKIFEAAGKAGYLINQAAGLVFTTGAGAASGVAQNHFDHLNGAEYLFGRNDWKDRYEALASGRKHSADGGRFDALANNVKTPKTWLNAIRNLVALSQLVEGFALGGGLGLANMSKSGASKAIASSMAKGLGSVDDVMKNPTNRMIRELAGQGAYIPVAAGAYFSQGAAAIAYDELKKAVKNKLGLNDESSTSSSSSSTTDTTDGDAPVSSGARTPDGTPAPSTGTEARTPDGTPAPSTGTEARTPDGTPAPSTGTPTKGPSEEGESDSDSVHSHHSGPLRHTPPERSSEMRTAADTRAWWHAFPGLADIKSPQPENLTRAEAETIVAVLEAEAEKMSERIAGMIPLPDSLPTSSASSVTSGSSEAAGPAGSPEPEEAKKAS